MNNILLTGRPGTGKTTLIKRVLDGWKESIGGFYTEEIRRRRVRVGFKIRSIAGDEAVLAHVDCPSPFRVSRYGVNIEALERVGVAAIERAIHENALIVMDELGRMELFSRRFQQVALRALDSPRRVLGVLQDRHTSFLDGIRARDDVEIIPVTLENRDGLVAVLRERLGS